MKMSKTLKRSFFILLGLAVGLIITLKYCPYFTTEVVQVNLLEEEAISDGPYLFSRNDSVDIEWISEGQLYSQTVSEKDQLHLAHNPSFKVDLEDLQKLNEPVPSSYSGVKHMAVISDMHGQYRLFIDLLKANKVIDEQGSWNFSNGHLVIVGDAFDRGDKVSEILWHIIKLKLQAERLGGQVHYILGNHDVMILNNDLRYLHAKYNKVEELMGRSFNEIFNRQSILGQWLRACPVVMRINDVLFVHAGLSPAVAQTNLSMDSINSIFATQIIDNRRDQIRSDERLSLLARSQGPIWYRGYFKDTTLTTARVDSVLQCFNANRIVVGHTSMDEVKTFFDTKVLAVDTSIKRGKSGEVLLIEDGTYYRAGLDGIKHKLW